MVPQARVVGVDGAKHLWVGEKYAGRVLNEIVDEVVPGRNKHRTAAVLGRPGGHSPRLRVSATEKDSRYVDPRSGCPFP